MYQYNIYDIRKFPGYSFCNHCHRYNEGQTMGSTMWDVCVQVVGKVQMLLTDQMGNCRCFAVQNYPS